MKAIKRSRLGITRVPLLSSFWPGKWEMEPTERVNDSIGLFDGAAHVDLRFARVQHGDSLRSRHHSYASHATHMKCARKSPSQTHREWNEWRPVRAVK